MCTFGGLVLVSTILAAVSFYLYFSHPYTGVRPYRCKGQAHMRGAYGPALQSITGVAASSRPPASVTRLRHPR